MGDEDEGLLGTEEQRFLLRLARNTLGGYVGRIPMPELDDASLPPLLRERRGAFVTLREGGLLRGCVGYPAHRAPLARTVQENTINAASRDPRFEPVTIDEFDAIAIEISVLGRGDTPDTPHRRISGVAEIEIGRDGLYLVHADGPSGLLLPQVPVEQGWTVEEFLEGICRKAGLPRDGWQDPETMLFRFQAQVFSESELGM